MWAWLVVITCCSPSSESDDTPLPSFDDSCSHSVLSEGDGTVMVDEDVLQHTISLSQRCSAEAIGEAEPLVVIAWLLEGCSLHREMFR